MIIISRYLHIKLCYEMLLDKISYKLSVYGGFNKWDNPVIEKKFQWLLQWEFAPVDKQYSRKPYQIVWTQI